MAKAFDIIIIGGSAGSVQVISQIIHELPAVLPVPVVIVLHRLKNVASEMSKILSAQTNKVIVEPDDKDPIKNSFIYLAPQNYHLLIESDFTFSLDYSEVVQYSRPSIDVTFESAAKVYGKKAFAVLLSGGNKDGTNGIGAVIVRGGKAIVQHPDSALYPAMPSAAIASNKGIPTLYPEQIIEYLNKNLNPSR
ncbi:chemotaxis protein CheB [Segetibacter sp. 3557_3]|uniref:chemotaxis protein CheB n=1 Tax=Segetibacter sp. 3557_3 TaxID=2547429 RepID=UPI001058C8D2|nr:chemotaxis protein CheB [Segetibacter sp. 3557_3]TDH29150.1 chemotaxis protein CheB [Segetibacter sp. 3557_3]